MAMAAASPSASSPPTHPPLSAHLLLPSPSSPFHRLPLRSSSCSPTSHSLFLHLGSCVSVLGRFALGGRLHRCKGNGRRHLRFLPPRADLGGQYEDNFADVDKHLLDYFTYKAVRTVLVQLYEMNPTQYSWFYNFVVEHKPQDSKLFLRALVKEKQDLCERVMVTRLHLYNKWIKKHDHGKMYRAISDQNLELLRERLVQTVKWADTEDTDKT